MKNPINLIYLFFLKYPIQGIVASTKYPYHLESQAFMFQHHLNSKTPLKWNYLFHVYQDYALDKEFGINMAHLIYHELVDERYQITKNGVSYLEENLERNPDFSEYISNYFNMYQKNHFLEDTFLDNKQFRNEHDYVPVSFYYIFQNDQFRQNHI